MGALRPGEQLVVEAPGLVRMGGDHQDGHLQCPLQAGDQIGPGRIEEAEGPLSPLCPQAFDQPLVAGHIFD